MSDSSTTLAAFEHDQARWGYTPIANSDEVRRNYDHDIERYFETLVHACRQS
jgi:hypothetical protein